MFIFWKVFVKLETKNVHQNISRKMVENFGKFLENYRIFSFYQIFISGAFTTFNLNFHLHCRIKEFLRYEKESEATFLLFVCDTYFKTLLFSFECPKIKGCWSVGPRFFQFAKIWNFASKTSKIIKFGEKNFREFFEISHNFSWNFLKGIIIFCNKYILFNKFSKLWLLWHSKNSQILKNRKKHNCFGENRKMPEFWKKDFVFWCQ